MHVLVKCPLAMCVIDIQSLISIQEKEKKKVKVGTPSLGDSQSLFHNACMRTSKGETKKDGFADLHIIVS